MNKKLLTKILIISFIITLSIGNLYFYKKAKRLDYAITIGTPIKDKVSDTVGIDFSNSKPLSNKEDSNLLIFSLMNATTIDKPQKCASLPDSTIYFSNWDEGITYYIVNIWLDENSIIIETNQGQQEYKIINNDKVDELKNLISRY